MSEHVHDLAIERVPVGKLHTYHRNPRQGDKAAIRASLRVNGQYKPIVVNRGTHTGRPDEVLAGNHTLMGARDEGWPDIAVCWVDVDEDQATRIVAADNRIGDLGSYDNRLLAEMLGGLDDLEGTGYDTTSLDELVAGLVDDPDPGAGTGEEQPGKGESLALAGSTVGEPRITTTHGEVWSLGRHTLVVADVHTEHELWSGNLTGEHLFWPYPTLLAPFAEQAQRRPVLMVQPNLYLAGWLLTKWAAISGQEPQQVQQAAAA